MIKNLLVRHLQRAGVTSCFHSIMVRKSEVYQPGTNPKPLTALTRSPGSGDWQRGVPRDWGAPARDADALERLTGVSDATTGESER